MTKFKNYFELNTTYKFDPTDLTATIYVLCTVLGIMGMNVTPLFLLGNRYCVLLAGSQNKSCSAECGSVHFKSCKFYKNVLRG